MVLHFTKARFVSSLPSFANGDGEVRAEFTGLSEGVEVGVTQRL